MKPDRLDAVIARLDAGQDLPVRLGEPIERLQFWRGDGVSYATERPQDGVIVGPGATLDTVVHELAHAWEMIARGESSTFGPCGAVSPDQDGEDCVLLWQVALAEIAGQDAQGAVDAMADAGYKWSCEHPYDFYRSAWADACDFNGWADVTPPWKSWSGGRWLVEIPGRALFGSDSWIGR